jgi:hypothetical protein
LPYRLRRYLVMSELRFVKPCSYPPFFAEARGDFTTALFRP